MKEDVWVFFRKLAGWHLATSLKGKIHERGCMKVFFVNLQAGIPQLHYRLTFSLVHEIRCSIRGVLKNLSKFSDKHKEQSSGGVLSKDVLKKFTKKTSLPESPFQQSCRLETLTQQKQPLEMSAKQGVLKNFANIVGKNLGWSLFLVKLEFWRPVTLLRKTPTQVFSCEIYELFKNNYFEEHLWTSKHYLKRDSNTGAFLWIL